jgi:hypothetical protein
MLPVSVCIASTSGEPDASSRLAAPALFMYLGL